MIRLMETIDRIMEKIYAGVPLPHLIDVQTMANVVRADELYRITHPEIRCPDIPISERTYKNSKVVMDYFSSDLSPKVKRWYRNPEKIFEDCMLVMSAYKPQQQ